MPAPLRRPGNEPPRAYHARRRSAIPGAAAVSGIHTTVGRAGCEITTAKEWSINKGGDAGVAARLLPSSTSRWSLDSTIRAPSSPQLCIIISPARPGSEPPHSALSTGRWTPQFSSTGSAALRSSTAVWSTNDHPARPVRRRRGARSCWHRPGAGVQTFYERTIGRAVHLHSLN